MNEGLENLLFPLTPKPVKINNPATPLLGLAKKIMRRIPERKQENHSNRLVYSNMKKFSMQIFRRDIEFDLSNLQT